METIDVNTLRISFEILDGKKPYYKKNFNNGSRNGEGYKPYGGRYNKKPDSPNVNVNEAEFPPLNEDNQQQ